MAVYVIEDHPLMRDALIMLIHRMRSDLKVVPVAQIGALVSAIEKNGAAELFCLDLNLPDAKELSGLHAIKTDYPRVALAVITGLPASEWEERCLEAGADVFIEKSNSPTRIIADLRKLLVASKVMTEEVSGSSTPTPTRLSKRQKQLIVMLDQGLSNREMAENLGISEHTVKVHFWRMFKLFGVHSRTQALHFARTNGWL